jgi:enoyl-CoA hydratase/carnithine racemase
MLASSPPIELPTSYATLNTRHIKVSHVPDSSPTPTPVVLITLNRPDKNNAFTNIMKDDMERVYSMIDVDDRVRCVVLTGAGRMFCAGADLEAGFPGGASKSGQESRAKAERATEHRDS